VFIDTVIWPHSATRHTHGSAEAKFSPVIVAITEGLSKMHFDLRVTFATEVELQSVSTPHNPGQLKLCCRAVVWPFGRDVVRYDDDYCLA